MPYQLLADLILLLHAAFVVFAMFGGLLAVRRPKVMWLHLPALAWGVIVQWADLICPLTPLENLLRLRAGDAPYAGAFIEHYVSRLLYPDALTIELRYLLGFILIAVNVAVYARVLLHRVR
ncbi:MAG TPA: DUF2784 domain-containing protein [Noviherbaspirillum sp.]